MVSPVQFLVFMLFKVMFLIKDRGRLVIRHQQFLAFVQSKVITGTSRIEPVA